jgi:putative metalloprotease
MSKKSSFVAVALVALFGILLSGCVSAGKLSSGIGAGSDAVKAATLSDDDVKKEALAAIEGYDKSNKLGPASDPYVKRLAKLVKKHGVVEGQALNYSVYLTQEVNAFAMADGSIRVYSGLMDMLTDEEILFVIGHEVGHVNLGHRKKALQVAYAASAARKGAEAKGGATSAVAGSALGDFAEKLINAQFSQKEERDADLFGLEFLKKNGYSPKAAVSALNKIQGLGGKHGIFSSHPDPGKRAKLLEESL